MTLGDRATDSSTATKMRSTTGWALTGAKLRRVAHVSIRRRCDSLCITGAGEKPINFNHLAEGEAGRLITLIHDLKARQAPTEPQDQTQ